jgi:hypothetical protein
MMLFDWMLIRPSVRVEQKHDRSCDMDDMISD